MKIIFKNYIPFLLLHKIFVISIQVTNITVPSTVAIGQRGILNCTWTQDNEALYLLKWDKGGDHFYSWSPDDDSPKVYQVEGVFIDASNSYGGYVEFITTSTKAANMYNCEVTADKPPFHTDQLNTTMNVVDLPDSRPYLRLDNLNPKMYDNITVGCISLKGFPGPQLNFFLNNDAIDQNHISLSSYEDEETGLKTIEANYTFVLKPYMFDNRELIIKCTAEINNVYWEPNEIVLPLANLLDWETTAIDFHSINGEQYDFQRSIVSKNQSNLMINLTIVIILLRLQTVLYV